MSKDTENRFKAYKISLCGNQDRRDYLYNLTLSEVQKLPLGEQIDKVGAYVWVYGIDD